MKNAIRTASLVLVGLVLLTAVRAQDNYEIQVYGSDTVEQGKTMVELHSNFTFSGSKTVENGVEPTNHAVHETLEITHGFTKDFEIGFYIFTSIRNGDGWDWVGSHIRPRVKAPDKWKLPVGLSLSAEFGYQRRKFSTDTWSLELRPIIDKQLAKWYVAFNPTLERSLKGINKRQGFEFSPNAKVAYNVTKKAAAGIEYYGAVGPVFHFDPPREQEQQFFAAVDLFTSPKWEFNFGVGVGVTRSTDHLIAKFIVGRKFEF